MNSAQEKRLKSREKILNLINSYEVTYEIIPHDDETEQINIYSSRISPEPKPNRLFMIMNNGGSFGIYNDQIQQWEKGEWEFMWDDGRMFPIFFNKLHSLLHRL